MREIWIENKAEFFLKNARISGRPGSMTAIHRHVHKCSGSNFYYSDCRLGYVDNLSMNLIYEIFCDFLSPTCSKSIVLDLTVRKDMKCPPVLTPYKYGFIVRSFYFIAEVAMQCDAICSRVGYRCMKVSSEVIR